MIWKIYLIFGILAELHPTVVYSPHTDVETDPISLPSSISPSGKVKRLSLTNARSINVLRKAIVLQQD